VKTLTCVAVSLLGMPVLTFTANKAC